MNLITEIQYFPSVILYKYLYKFSNTVFEEYESYQKMSFRNRCIIAGANGPIILSVPLEAGRNQKTIMKDVRISNSEKWQSQHWKSIESSYNKSPWFEFYKDELKALYEKKFDFLMDWDIYCFEWSIKKLDAGFSFSGSKSFIKKYNTDEFLDFRNTILPKNYIKFETVKYAQVFEERTGFLPNLSILDLLFCEGKNSANLLKGQPL
ncbi:MAG: WbqC family protein [Bacteroidetes bacterium]|nr:WbqC family protein [Bacteroidota bacterium]